MKVALLTLGALPLLFPFIKEEKNQYLLLFFASAVLIGIALVGLFSKPKVKI